MQRCVLAALLCVGLAGCKADLGDCTDVEIDEQRANIVFLFSADGDPAIDGTPMLAGQALVHTQCVSCHGPGATGATRAGAPAGLDFDLSLACKGMEDTNDCDVEEADELRGQQNNVFDHRFDIMRTLERGTMPPEGVGQTRVESAPIIYGEVDDVGIPVEGSQLPAIDTPAGRDIVRRWLACGAPVVQEAILPSGSRMPGQQCDTASTDCSQGGDSFGCCIVQAPANVEPPEQNWTSIWERMFNVDRCTACHSPDGDEDQFAASGDLDFSDKDTAYMLLNGDAAGDECGGTGALIDTAAASCEDSIMIQKLRDTQDCGDAMPPTGDGAPSEWVDVVCAWIEEGAPDN